MENYNWIFNEFQHSGVNHSEENYPEKYEAMMGRVRDYEKEAKYIIDRLNINRNHAIADFGAGTGAFVIPAAKYCKQVYAIDTSKPMLDFIKNKAKKEKINNITLIQKGFLTIRADFQFDFVITKTALHHVPDFWKMLALKNIYTILKPGGIFYLSDIIFSFSIESYENELNKMVQHVEEKFNKDLADEAIIHIKEEFSTFDWIMEEMIKKTGFSIEEKIEHSKTRVEYICQKPVSHNN